MTDDPVGYYPADLITRPSHVAADRTPELCASQAFMRKVFEAHGLDVGHEPTVVVVVDEFHRRLARTEDP